MRSTLLRSLLLFVATSLTLGGLELQESRDERLGRLLTDLRATGAPGLAAAFADRRTPVATVSTGVASLEHQASVDGNTPFRLASVSKAVTAVALAALVEKGLIDLDRPVGDYIPSLPAAARPITSRQLAGHLSGIRHYRASDNRPGADIDRQRYASLTKALPIFINDALESPPGAEYRYSTFGYTLLGAVMEAGAGRSFERILNDEVAAPLGLETVGVDVPERIVPGRTRFFERAADGTILHAPFVDSSHKVPGAGLLASASDMAQLGLALTDDRLLTSTTRELLFTGQRTHDGKETGVGLGWRISRDPFGKRVWHHEGSMKGARSALLIYPDDGVAVSLLSNLTATPLFAFETAATLAAVASGGLSPACPAALGGNYVGTATLDGVETRAEGDLRVEAHQIRGGVTIAPIALPVATRLRIVDGWCDGQTATLILLIRPNFGFVPIHVTVSASHSLEGRTAIQGGHRFALSLRRR